MRLVRSLSELTAESQRGAVTIGNFDGVHRGHARIIERLRAMADKVGGPAVVFTFEPHPVRLLRPSDAPPPLTWADRKAELVAALGVDTMVTYPTDAELLALGPDAFFRDIVCEHLQAKAMVEGPNFFFGRARAGNIELLGELCTQAGICLEVVEPLKLGAEYISSSRIRQLISNGDVELAGTLLTQPYRIRGMVTHGAARGAKIGFPTANVDAIDTLLPAVGVYGGQVRWNGEQWLAAVNVGPSPTFGQDMHRVEAHLIGFNGTLYGQPLEVDFLHRLRDIRPFDSVDQLKEQLARDVAAVTAAAAATAAAVRSFP